MKNLLLILSSFFMSTQLFGQKDIVNDNSDTFSICINKKKVGEYIIKPGGAETDLIIKKAAAKTIKKIELQVKGSLSLAPRYKRTIEMGDTKTVIINETKDMPGHFNILTGGMIKELTAGKKILLHLVLEPANDMMMFPSKRILLGNLIMK